MLQVQTQEKWAKESFMADITQISKKEERAVARKRDWFILSSLVSKDFKLKYRRSVLGVLWSVLNPLLMMVVLTAVFSFMFRFDIENFPLYLILGNTLFALMSNSTTSAMTSIINAASLIKKVRINKMVFPIETVLFEMLNFAISLIAVAMVMIYFQVWPGWSLLLLPLVLVYTAVFSAGLGLLLSALSVFFRDLVHLWSVVVTAWTYLTPLFYPITMLPQFMQDIMQWNPMYQYVAYLRDIMMYGIFPSFEQNLICIGMAVVTFVVGLFTFRKLEHRFILFV